ncbi:protein Shroom-like [Uranotaenia lowii]|uniref:protein Shroom-like n=1 Tax=Uranotaenia lowii TaxID=190385 RepID=UPI0024785A16|nr:protein Shroom-like [Uranotaenia lowii]
MKAASSAAKQQTPAAAKCHRPKASLDWDTPSTGTGTIRRQFFATTVDKIPTNAERQQSDHARGQEPSAGCVTPGPADKQTGFPNRGNVSAVATGRQSKIAVLRQQQQQQKTAGGDKKSPKSPPGSKISVFQKTTNLLSKTTTTVTGDNKQGNQQKLKNNIIPQKKLVKQQSDVAVTEKSSGESGEGVLAGREKKKVSFIPSLATAEGAGGIKSSTVKAIVRSRINSDSGAKFKELYRDFPATQYASTGCLSENDQSNPGPPPLPPYREPPPPPPTLTSVKVEVLQQQQQDLISMEQPAGKNEDIQSHPSKPSKLKAFGLGKLMSGTGATQKGNNYVTLPPSPKMSKMSSKESVSGGTPPPTPAPEDASPARSTPDLKQPSPDDILTKPEFSSLVLRNLPVRQKKGAVPHLENYCLFDPSVDFFNEKEHKMRPIPETVELADPVLYQNPLIYDAVDRDSDNYFTIEPESYDVEARNRLSLEKVEEKIDEIFNKTSRTSSSSSGSSPDYPSMVNSVIETPSSNLESTDESDYGFRNRLIGQLQQVVPKSISGGAISGTEDQSQESSYYGVVTKTAVSQLQLLRQQLHMKSASLPNSPLLKQRKSDESSPSSSPPSTQALPTATGPEPAQDTSSPIASPPPPAPCNSHTSLPSSPKTFTKIKSLAAPGPATPSTRLHFLPLLSHLEALKSSVSLPHLQRPGTGAISKQQSTGSTAPPIFNRLRKQRPLSSHSDADSGFLSPVTPPDSGGIQSQLLLVAAAAVEQISCSEAQSCGNRTGNNSSNSNSTSSSEVIVLEQCDSIQELIQVSDANDCRFKR